MSTAVNVSDAAAPMFPYRCAACLREPADTHSIVVSLREAVYLERSSGRVRAGHKDHQLEFNIPYCARHLQASLHSARKLRRALRLRQVLAFLSGAGLGGGVAQALYRYTYLLEQQPLHAAGILVGVFFAGLLLSRPLWLIFAAKLAGVGAPCRALFRPGSHSTLSVAIIPPPEKLPEGGSIELRFANPQYGELFCKMRGQG